MNFIAASLSSVFKQKDSVLKESPDELASHLRGDLLDLTQTELTEEQTATLVCIHKLLSPDYSNPASSNHMFLTTTTPLLDRICPKTHRSDAPIYFWVHWNPILGF